MEFNTEKVSEMLNSLTLGWAKQFMESIRGDAGGSSTAEKKEKAAPNKEVTEKLHKAMKNGKKFYNWSSRRGADEQPKKTKLVVVEFEGKTLNIVYPSEESVPEGLEGLVKAGSGAPPVGKAPKASAAAAKSKAGKPSMNDETGRMELAGFEYGKATYTVVFTNAKGGKAEAVGVVDDDGNVVPLVKGAGKRPKMSKALEAEGYSVAEKSQEELDAMFGDGESAEEEEEGSEEGSVEEEEEGSEEDEVEEAEGSLLANLSQYQRILGAMRSEKGKKPAEIAKVIGDKKITVKMVEDVKNRPTDYTEHYPNAKAVALADLPPPEDDE